MKSTLKKNIGLLLMSVLLVGFIQTDLIGQNRDSLNRRPRPDFDNLDKLFDDFKKDIEKDFDAFRDSLDLEFIEFMKKNWEQFRAFGGKKSPIDRKPVDTPRAPEQPEDNVPDKIKEDPKPRDPVPDVPDLGPRKRLIPNKQREKEKMDFPDVEKPDVVNANFYDAPFSVSVDKAYGYQLARPFENGIPDAWLQLAGARFFPKLYNEINTVADNMQLNDWGYLILIQNVARQIYPNNINQQVIFTCFTLNKSGYQVKMGYNTNEIYLLIPSYQQIYEKPYLSIENIQFYIFTFGRQFNRNLPVTTYRGQYADNSRLINFNFARPLKISNKVAAKRLSFEYDYQVYNVDVRYNPTNIQFYQDMPHVEFEVTLSSPLSTTAFESIKRALLPLLEGKSEREQINILLRFVQKSFEYKTDKEQFGTERYLYPEEVIHFPYSDCEDRSAMFSTLVRNILGMEVIGLIFPNHLATAVKFNDSVQGDYLDYQGKRFVICDPTYIGADAGMCMPRFKNAQATIVPLR